MQWAWEFGTCSEGSESLEGLESYFWSVKLRRLNRLWQGFDAIKFGLQSHRFHRENDEFLVMFMFFKKCFYE